jgi:molybdopterin converting factor subunit 1
MKIKILLFAGLREKRGEGDLELEVPPGTPARELAPMLFPEGSLSAESWRKVRFAVNLDYVPSGTVLHEGDEVALIPPVAGG